MKNYLNNIIYNYRVENQMSIRTCIFRSLAYSKLQYIWDCVQCEYQKWLLMLARRNRGMHGEHRLVQTGWLQAICSEIK